MRLSFSLAILACLWKWGNCAKAPSFPLRTSGRYILDAQNARVKLACVNWYGAHLQTFVQNGLYLRTPHEIAADIASLGFNCVRLSYSVEAYMNNPMVRPAYISKLQNSTDRRFMDVFDEVVDALAEQHLMIFITCHNSDAGWCCTPFDDNGIWYNSKHPDSAWIESLQGMATRYSENEFVVGYDLRNEVRPNIRTFQLPVWGDRDTNYSTWFWTFPDWRDATERAGLVVLNSDPHALIIVEGLGGFMLCEFMLKDYPFQTMQGHIVWSVHEYFWLQRELSFSWDVCQNNRRQWHFLSFWRYMYEDWIPPFWALFLIAGLAVALGACCHCESCDSSCSKCSRIIAIYICIAVVLRLLCEQQFVVLEIDSYDAFAKSRDVSYGHIVNNGLGPLWIGEFGTDKPNKFWNWTIDYMRERDIDFAYWAVDGEHYPSMARDFGEHVSGLPHDETFGIWKSDYRTVRHEWKLQQLQSLIAPSGSGATEERHRKTSERSERSEL